jgi:hypothetical protein
MKAAIELARKMSKQLDKNWLPEFEEINLHKIFQPIFSLPHNILTLNTISCYCIFAYDNDSSWLNLKQDRLENKMKILRSLTDDCNSELLRSISENENEVINDVIAEYLTSQATWKWKHIMSQLDFYTNTMKFVNQRTEEEKTIEKMNKEGEVKSLTTEYDVDVLAKVAKLKGELLKQAQEAREDADRLLSDIKKEFVQLDHAVQSDFGFELTDEKKINIESWKDFIRYTLPKLKEKQKATG